jgi:hypothetical protein
MIVKYINGEPIDDMLQKIYEYQFAPDGRRSEAHDLAKSVGRLRDYFAAFADIGRSIIWLYEKLNSYIENIFNEALPKLPSGFSYKLQGIPNWSQATHGGDWGAEMHRVMSSQDGVIHYRLHISVTLFVEGRADYSWLYSTTPTPYSQAVMMDMDDRLFPDHIEDSKEGKYAIECLLAAADKLGEYAATLSWNGKPIDTSLICIYPEQKRFP